MTDKSNTILFLVLATHRTGNGGSHVAPHFVRATSVSQAYADVVLSSFRPLRVELDAHVISMRQIPDTKVLAKAFFLQGAGAPGSRTSAELEGDFEAFWEDYTDGDET